MSGVQYIFVVQRRRRGIWMAEWSEGEWSTDGHDAFGTEAEAKRWCADRIGRKRLPWELTAPGTYIAEVIIDSESEETS